MASPTLVWQTEGGGKLVAEANGYRVFVGRVLPAQDAWFVVWDRGSSSVLARGVRASTWEAMIAAEQNLAGLPQPGRAARVAVEITPLMVSGAGS